MQAVKDRLISLFVSKQACLLLAAFLFLASLEYIIHANKGVYADDDNMWFYSLSYKIVDPAGFTALEDQVIEAFKKDDSTPQMLARLKDKQDYTYNYYFSTVMWTIGRNIVDVVKPDAPYPEKVADSITYGFALAFAVTIALFTLIILWARLPVNWWYALAFMAAFMAVTAVMAGPKPPQFMIMNLSAPSIVANLLWFMTDPSFGFSLFSFTGRNNYILFTLAAVIVRWRGHYSLFYALCALSFVIHASMAMLMLLMFIVIDSLLRPEIFRRKAVIASIALSFAYYFYIETLWQKVGYLALALVVPLALLVLFGVFQDKILAFVPRIRSFVLSVRERAASNIAGWDVLLFGVCWIGSFFPIMLMSGIVNPDQYIYFWSQLHVRVLSIWQPALVFAFFLWVFSGMGQDFESVKKPFVILGAICVIFAGSFLYMKQSRQIGFYPITMRETVQKFDDIVSRKKTLKEAGYALPDKCYFPEGLIWYSAIKEYVLDDGTMQAYMKAKPRGHHLDCMKK